MASWLGLALWLGLWGASPGVPQQAFPLDPTFTLDIVREWAGGLGKELSWLAETATQEKEILRKYREAASVVELDPEKEVQRMAGDMSDYMASKSRLAWKAKMSMESRDIEGPKSEAWSGYNDFIPPPDGNINGTGAKTGIHFVRYLNAKTGDDSAQLTKSRRVPATDRIESSPDGLLYDLRLNRSHSTVHVPTPVYNRRPELLSRVKWSRIDDFFRSHKEVEQADLGFQMYCARQGFLRFFPGREWPRDPQSAADIFDCRNSEWFINGATNSKNLLILLDMSGSMLGQRLEMAKQTMESIMETLSENDFFNIVWFNDEPHFLADCFQHSLIQASLRNKLLLRSKLNHVKASGIANYEKALPLAFNTLRGLGAPNVTRRSSLGETWRPGPFDLLLGRGQVILMDEEDMELMVNSSATLGCNSAIMLITDGASETYTEIFKRFNPDKKIRLFSYLIGDEATDFREVTWMACFNQGFMTHIANLADVQEKVQRYVEVMSRPVAAAADSNPDSTRAVWTGVYDERLFHPHRPAPSHKRRPNRRSPRDVKLVTTVAYPVVVNATVEGVVGVAVPMQELSQLAPLHLLGSKGYSFLVDNNGYVLYHPQLRPFDLTSAPTISLKPNYNSMDFLEMEVLQNMALEENSTLSQELDFYAEIRSELVEGRSSDSLGIHYSLETLYAMDPGEAGSLMPVKRVYKQSNEYFYRPIKDTMFTLGLAVPRDSRVRVEPRTPTDYSAVELEWLAGSNWKLHPDWRYCYLNASDAGDRREAGFREYVKDMRRRGALPPRCLRGGLVDLLLFDAQQTAFLDADWVSKWRLDSQHGVHLVFFAAQSGLTRFVDSLHPDVVYDPNPPEPLSTTPPTTTSTTTPDPNSTATPSPSAAPGPTPTPSRIAPYLHYVKLRTRAREEIYYQRAVRHPENSYVFELNHKTKVFLAQEYESAYGKRENTSLVVAASKAIFLDKDGQKAPVGVVGFEMLYDNLAQMTFKASGGDCGADPTGLRCYLLDEHGYVVFSSDLRLGSVRMGSGETSESGPTYESVITGPVAQRGPLGKFFGDLDAPERAIMKGLVAQGVYQDVVYVDFQAICADEQLDSAAARLLAPLHNLLSGLLWLAGKAALLLKEAGLWAPFAALLRPVAAYTSSFRGNTFPLPCDKASHFYILEPSAAREPRSADVTTSNVCGSARCSMYSYVAPVPSTNLLLVAFKLRPEGKNKASQCFAAACTAHQDPANPTIRFDTVYNASDKIFTPHGCKPEPRLRRAPDLCYPRSNKTESNKECSRSTALAPLSALLLLASLALTLARTH